MKNIFTTAVLLLCIVSAHSQISAGRDFWFGFMQNYYLQQGEMRVYISAETNAQGIISAPGQGWSQTFTVVPGTATQIIVPYSVGENLQSDTIIHKALHVSTDSLVSVFAHYYQDFSADASIILPDKALGHEYVVTSWHDTLINNGNNEFLIAATEDSTLIEVTPSTMAGMHPAGVTFTLLMDSGEIFQLQADTGDLTGSVVHGTNNKNFAVFAGHICANVVGCGYCDHLFDQLLPTNVWGTEYILVPYLNRDYDIFRVLALQNGTQFQVDSGTITTLNAGQFAQFAGSAVSRLTANAPVSVTQYSTGTDCDADMDSIGDPFSITLSPTTQSVKFFSYNAFVNPSPSFVYYANIIAKTNDTATITFDGVNIGTAFTPVPQNPDYCYLQLVTAQGNHTITAVEGVMVYAYGYGLYESYGYSAGIQVDVPTLVIYDTIKAGERYDFNGNELTNQGPSFYIAQSTTTQDSLLILQLAVLPPVRASVTASICAGSGYNLNGTQLNAPGQYTDTIISTTGPDTIIALTLTAGLPAQSLINDSICEGRFYTFHGLSISQAGQYTDTLQTTAGCDSVIILSLDVKPFTAPVITRVGDTLLTGSFDTYRWLRDNVEIPGANGRTLITNQDGSYTVVAGNANGCSDTSQALQIVNTGIRNAISANGLAKLYPNPTAGMFTLELASDETSTITITNCLGQTILSETRAGRKKQFTMPDVASGLYFISFKMNGLTQTLKFTLL